MSTSSILTARPSDGSSRNHAWPGGALALLDQVTEKARELAADAMPANTKRSYRADWQHFEAWCDEHLVNALPASPQTVALYVADLAGRYKASTLRRRLATINRAHDMAGYAKPGRVADEPLKSVWRGMLRRRPPIVDKKAPVLTEDLRAMCGRLGSSLRDHRDRALLLVGFAAALRRSELAALAVEDLRFTRDGVVVVVRRSKTDQAGEGASIGVPFGKHPETCPVRSLRTWLDVAGVGTGPVFRSVDRWENVGETGLSGNAVANIVKERARTAGLNPDDYAGHSLRAGLITQASIEHVPEHVTMKQSRHRSERVFRGYVRDARLFADNAAAAVGL